MPVNTIDIHDRIDMPWYAGVSIPRGAHGGQEAEELCSNYIRLLFITPQSRAIELILDTLEHHRDAGLIARCMSDAMAYITHMSVTAMREQFIARSDSPDYATTHDFDHQQNELRKALRMSAEEFAAAVGMITVISGELFMNNINKAFEIKVDPSGALPVFERVLASGSWTDLQKATALYLFLAMPIRQELANIEELNADLARRA